MQNNVAYEPGDIIIESLKLINIQNGKSLDIFDQVHSINIFESIKAPVISGIIDIIDGINMKEEFPIVQHKCKIAFKIKNEKNLPTRSFELLITEISNSVIDPNSNYSNYQLILCSTEILDNAKQLFTISMRKRKIDDYINYIMTDIIKTKKNIVMDPSGTKGIQDLDLIQMKPFQSIDFLRRRAVSTKYKSSAYSFFENKEGFVFAPIEYLFEQDNRKIKNGEFFYDTDIKQDITNMHFRNILAYNHITQQSTAKMLQEGALKNTTTSLDLRTRSYQVTTFDLKEQFKNFVFPGKTKSLNVGNFEEEYGKVPSISNFSINSSKNPNDHLVDKIGFNKAFVELLTQNILRILTWGDSNLSAGYRIQCHTPAVDGKTTIKSNKKNEDSSYFGGEYLISSIRHMFNKVEGKYRYFNSMELIKGIYGETSRI